MLLCLPLFEMLEDEQVHLYPKCLQLVGES